MKSILFILLLLLLAPTAEAGFRCGTKIVKEGDSVAKLMDSCGSPKHQYWAHEDVGDRGRRYTAKVLNYVYARGSKKNMIVSVRGGTVVKISVD